MQVPTCVKCRDVHCKDETHLAEIDEFATNILEIVDNSISAMIRKNEKNENKSKVVPGWNVEVQPFRDEAMFWHAIWISYGKPLNTPVHLIMKSTRNKYHYALRRCKRSVEIIKKNKLLDACINGKGNIFDEIRKIRKVKKNSPQCIDGCNNVPEKFANVYEELFNSTNDKHETLKTFWKVDNAINNSSLSDVDLVDIDVIKKATERIENSKNDPVFIFNSDSINTLPIFYLVI